MHGLHPLDSLPYIVSTKITKQINFPAEEEGEELQNEKQTAVLLSPYSGLLQQVSKKQTIF